MLFWIQEGGHWTFSLAIWKQTWAYNSEKCLRNTLASVIFNDFNLKEQFWEKRTLWKTRYRVLNNRYSYIIDRLIRLKTRVENKWAVYSYKVPKWNIFKLMPGLGTICQDLYNFRIICKVQDDEKYKLNRNKNPLPMKVFYILNFITR